jgi:hypothetical protein
LAAPLLRETAVVEKRYESPLDRPRTSGTAALFLDLVINAGQAIADQGNVVVRT